MSEKLGSVEHATRMAKAFTKESDDLRQDIADANEQMDLEDARKSKLPYNVSFELPPFEAGMLLGVLAKELQYASVIDDVADPIRKTALTNTWKILTQQLSDWQRGRGDAQ